MAEQWQALAATATSALIQAWLQPLGPSFESIAGALHFRRWQLDVQAAGGIVVPWQSFDLVGPTEMLDQASREIARFNEINNRLVRVVSIYGGRYFAVLTDGPLWSDLALHTANPLWQSWVQRRADALNRTDRASQGLRNVAAYDLATVDAFTVARSFPEGSASFTAWMLAAENIGARGEAEFGAASQNARNMVNAVSSEFTVGMEIFNLSF